MPRITGTDKTGISIGTIIPVGQSAGLPAGALLCDGLAVSRSVFSKLFGIIGTTWGPGDGSTTFNVPDLRGKALIGSGQDSGHSLSNRVVAQYIGEEVHTLSAAESGLPAHNHPVSDPGHTHVTGNGHNFVTDGPGGVQTGGTILSVVSATANAASNITVSNAPAAAASTSHNNMQPSTVVQWAIVYV